MHRYLKVYVVDDDSSMRESLRFLLESHSVDVEAFASARDFLAAGGARKTGCVIADVRMPDMTGLELQQELVRAKSELAVILITGHADVPMAVRAMRAGAFDFLEKPIAEDALLQSLQRALGARKKHLPQAGADPARIASISARLALLTAREREVLDHLVQGNPHKVIAHELEISPRTVEVHRARIMQKLEARNLAHLVEMMLTSGAKAPHNW